MFDQEGADEKLKDWMARHRGRRAFFLFERVPAGAPAGAAAARGAGVASRSSTSRTTSSPWRKRICDGRGPPVSPRRCAARRQRFVEAGGVVPGGGRRSARCSRRSSAAASSCPSCCSRTSARCARLVADPCLRRPKPPDADRARGARRRPAGAADLRRAAAAAAPGAAATRCCGSARASSGGGRPTRWRASCRRSPTPAWTSRSRSATRELRRELGEPRADDGAPVALRGDGDGQARAARS